MDLRALLPLACALVCACTIYDDTCGGLAERGFRCSQDLDESGSDTEANACFDGDEPATLRIENRTGNAIEVVDFVRCDGTDASQFPLTPPGLADGDDVEIPLPGPGCWLLDYSGEGCEGDMPHETPTDVCAGDTYVWTPDELHHACVG
jgi:hypothetical protein